MEAKNRKHLIETIIRIIAIIAAILGLLLPFALAIYDRLASDSWPGWSGFGDYQPPTAGFQHAKTLWDWLDLIIAPLMLALVGFGINSTIRKNEERSTEERTMEDALQSFLDKIDELLTNPKLYKDADDGRILRNYIRARTLTTLRRLDAKRKSILMDFLTGSCLVSKRNGFVIIDLSGADLEGVELSDANLEDAILNKAKLKGAALDHCNLNGVSLIEADLQSSRLAYCFLENAQLHPEIPDARARITNMCGANLIGTSLLNTDLFDVRFDNKTILPDGTNWRPNSDLARFTNRDFE